MFGFSLGEFIIVSAIALLLFTPHELVGIVKSLKRFFAQIEEYYKAYLEYFNRTFNDLSSEEDEIVNHILDLEGNLQKTYDLSKIMPHIDHKKDDL